MALGWDGRAEGPVSVLRFQNWRSLSLSTLQSREKRKSVWLPKVSSSSSLSNSLSSSSSPPPSPPPPPLLLFLPASPLHHLSETFPWILFLGLLRFPTSSALPKTVFILIHFSKHLWSNQGVPGQEQRSHLQSYPGLHQDSSSAIPFSRELCCSWVSC